MHKITLVVLLLVLHNSLQWSSSMLPTYDGPEITQYSGYITVDEKSNRNLFYWLIESQNDPDTDPLVIWYQGGPGCSGLFGLFAESGPYMPDGNGGIQYNPISWTQVANVLYLEQPAGVGFSYSDNPDDYNTNDFKAANDNFLFLEGFLAQYPQYVGRETWLSGESYAGVYIPTLTAVILNNSDSLIYSQLTGLTLGNPVIGCESADYNAIQFNLFYWHGLVSHIVLANWTSHLCDIDSSNDGCDEIFNVAMTQIGVIFQQVKTDANGITYQTNDQPSLDPDDLYQDFCLGNGTLDFADNLGYPDSCYPVGNQMTDYLNRPDVQEIIGAKSTNWVGCTGAINYTSNAGSMIPYYNNFFNQRPDLGVLVYSGDVDIFTVPFGYTQACLVELKQDIQKVWGPWMVNGATAGYYEVFEQFVYATLKGAGHESPEYQPLTSLAMFSRFIQNSDLADPNPSRVKSSPIPVLRTQGGSLKQHGIRG